VLTVGSLFSGIGGIELGLERTGYFKTAWFVEVDGFCQSVLRKHWPSVPIHGDITKIDWDSMPRVDMLTGGFPCQDISVANPRGKGIGGSRSGLWKEYAKAIGILRPKYALIENVPAIVRKGLHVVLGDLAEAGYDAEWFDLRASDFGALHRRERIFIVAYRDAERTVDGESGEFASQGGEHALGDIGARIEKETDIAYSNGQRHRGRCDETLAQKTDDAEVQGRGVPIDVTISHGDGFDGASLPILKGRPRQDNPRNKNGAATHPDSIERGKISRRQPDDTGRIITHNWRERIQRFVEKKIQTKQGFSWCQDVRRVEDLQGRPDIPQPLFRGGRDGIPDWVHRIKALGNAVVPDCAEFIGEMIMEFDRKERRF